ncbi:hypothetical protein [Ectothiorhodospira shaposhnikovii]|nr:hypothetical protein [Ectothiorhodospira shaposhnikovii]
MSTTRQQTTPPRHPAQQSLISRLIAAVASVLFWLLIARGEP